MPIYNRLKDRKVLEELKQFLAPLRLPKTADHPGRAVRRPTSSRMRWNGVATICYELIEQIERVAAG